MQLGSVLKATLLTLVLALPISANAQSSEQKFQDVFITAGYATAFGAALGAASLSFFKDPAQHLRLVAVGASLGFIGGSILGSYVVLSPGFATNEQEPSSTLLASGIIPSRGLALRPVFDPSKGSLTQVEGAMTLLNF